MITRLSGACLRRSGAKRNWPREHLVHRSLLASFSTSQRVLKCSVGPFRTSNVVFKSKEPKDNKPLDNKNDPKKAHNEDESHTNESLPSTDKKKKKDNDDFKQNLKSSSNKTEEKYSATQASKSKNDEFELGGEENEDEMPLNGEFNKNVPAKYSVPDVYPQLLALPIARRPLFPGFYKAIVTKNPSVSEAIKELIKKRQPYIGAFLLKDENADTDVITNIDQVYPVGVFAQITSIFPAKSGGEPALTAVLYPHRRIRITELIPPKEDADSAASSDAAELETDKSSNLSSNGEVKSDLKQDNGKEEPEKEVESTPSILQNFKVSLVNVENVPNEPFKRQDPVIKAVTSEIMNVFKDIANVSPLFREQIANFSISQTSGNVFDEPAKLADFAAAVSAADHRELQEVLEATNIGDRLQKALYVLKKELLNAQLQHKINKEIEQKITQRHKEYLLTEQLKQIKRELGQELDSKEALVTEFKKRTESLSMPDHVKKVFNDELSKFQHLEPMAAEFNITRNYLDWITQLPWGKRSVENFDLDHAKEVLDRDHYGLKDVKDRVLELVAVGKLRGTMQGKIMCLVGPPGVGKTSVGKSIASALNREFFRFSVGGLTDVAEIKGHRRTYIGAMPGKIVQALKKVQTENPLILIDEIDKVGKSHQGDPASALLELLDSEQNSAFLDYYMDIPLDVSSVLFVCTANTIDTIPPPLLDRMEVIELSGYVSAEKVNIAKGYLIPQAKAACGLKDANVNISDDAIKGLISYYAHESGVRNLKKSIEKIFRKTSFSIVKEIDDELNSKEKSTGKSGKKTSPQSSEDAANKEASSVPLKVPDKVNIEIEEKDLTKYLGPPIYTSQRLYDTTPPGVVMGLGWTPMGGVSMYVETIVKNILSSNSTPSLERTGQLGDVMKESSEISYSFSKSFLSKHFPNNKFFEHARLHMHCPEGSISKDGPSAGITMATSLLSLALDTPVPATTAMTGELTLTGKILRIGGLREKTVAAKLSGMKEILFPKSNLADWEQLPDYVKEGLTGVPVAWYDDVFKRVFSNIDAEKCNNLWPNLIKSSSKQHQISPSH
ncbi:hypothetical protein POMI540_0216 [Schizosaccharomyces pombe]